MTNHNSKQTIRLSILLKDKLMLPDNKAHSNKGPASMCSKVQPIASPPPKAPLKNKQDFIKKNTKNLQSKSIEVV